METTQPSTKKFAPFMSMLHQVLKPTQFNWNPRSFVPHAPVDLKRFMELASQLRTPGSEINLELSQYVGSVGGFQNPQLWDVYLRSYDKTAAFSSGMLNVASVMDEIMPKEGRIAEFGAGSGNISSFLALDEPGRHIVALDFAPGALLIAAEKLNHVTGFNTKRYETVHFDLKEDRLPKAVQPKSLDGAVMNNVLYTLGSHKQTALANIRAAMKDGAPVVISDVINLSQSEFIGFLVETAVSSLQNGSPAREIDIALVGKMNLSVLLNGQRSEEDRLLTIEQHRALYEEAGFVVHGMFRSYHKASVLFYMTAGEPKVLRNDR